MSNNIKTKKRIRIGNDIKLDVYLSDKYVSDAVNIQNVKCVLINTTMAFEFVEDDDCHHHTHRIHEHKSTACSLHSCGHHKYHCEPHWENINCHDNHCNDCRDKHCHLDWYKLDDDHGLYHNCNHCHGKHHHCHHCHHHAHYHPCVCHHGHLIMKHPFGYPHHEEHCHPCFDCHNADMRAASMFSYGRYNDFLMKCVDKNTTLYHDLGTHPITPFEYVPELVSTPERNHFLLLFPAADQLFIGEYTLVVTALIYESGYNKKNTRTVTIDYPVVFELVDHSCDADEDVTITVGLPERENVQYLCACGSNIDTVLKGNVGILTAKVMPKNSSYKEIVWSNPSGGLTILNEEGETVKYIGSCCDIESGEQTFTMRASSKHFEDKYVDFEVHVINYAKKIQAVVSESTILPIGGTCKFDAEVVMQNSERVQYYNKGGEVKSATYIDGSVKDDDGTTLATISNNGSGTYTITNVNPKAEQRTVRVIIKSSLPTEDDSELSNVIMFTLAGTDTKGSNDCDCPCS